MPCLGLTVLIPALAPGDAAWEWDVMAWSIPAGTGTESSASSLFLETPAPVAPWEGMVKGTGWDWCYLGLEWRVLHAGESRMRSNAGDR